MRPITLRQVHQLIASYGFDHSSGDLIDISGNLGNGTLNGDANYVASTALSTDIFAPLFDNTFPSVSAISPSGFTIDAQLNEESNVYYVVTLDAAGANPSATNVFGRIGGWSDGDSGKFIWYHKSGWFYDHRGPHSGYSL